jgi:flotillin
MNPQALESMPNVFFSVCAVVFAFILLASIIRRFRMCPPNKILVVFGKVGGTQASRCFNGGSTFVMPIFQSYEYLDLSPMTIDISLGNALSSQNIRVNVPATFTVAISNEPEIMGNAATRLLGKSEEDIQNLSREIITGQMRVVIASMTIEQINSDREKLIGLITQGVDVELRKVGLHLINCNITDITDASGYIDALGKEAAAKAINDANVKVSQENQRGAIGQAEAEREQAIRVAEAQAAAAIGRNKAQQAILASQAELAERKAEADKRAEIAAKTAKAQADQAAYNAEKITQDARLSRDESFARADRVAQANVDKEKVRVDAEAKAQMVRIEAEGRANAVRAQAQGDADATVARAKGDAEATVARANADAEAIRVKLTAEADGKKALLDAQAEGLAKFANADAAVQILVAQQIPELARTQADAVKSLKIDKVVVMGGTNGNTGAGSFVQDLFRNVLPLHETAEAAGITLPGLLGTLKSDKGVPPEKQK